MPPHARCSRGVAALPFPFDPVMAALDRGTDLPRRCVPATCAERPSDIRMDRTGRNRCRLRNAAAARLAFLQLCIARSCEYAALACPGNRARFTNPAAALAALDAAPWWIFVPRHPRRFAHSLAAAAHGWFFGAAAFVILAIGLYMAVFYLARTRFESDAAATRDFANAPALMFSRPFPSYNATPRQWTLPDRDTKRAALLGVLTLSPFSSASLASSPPVASG